MQDSSVPAILSFNVRRDVTNAIETQAQKNDLAVKHQLVFAGLALGLYALAAKGVNALALPIAVVSNAAYPLFFAALALSGISMGITAYAYSKGLKDFAEKFKNNVNKPEFITQATGLDKKGSRLSGLGLIGIGGAFAIVTGVVVVALGLPAMMTMSTMTALLGGAVALLIPASYMIGMGNACTQIAENVKSAHWKDIAEASRQATKMAERAKLAQVPAPSAGFNAAKTAPTPSALPTPKNPQP